MSMIPNEMIPDYIEISAITGVYYRYYVVHEIVHYLQQQAGYLGADVIPCDIRIDLEREAYRVQHYFLKEHNESTDQVDLALALLKSFCSPP